MNLSAINHNQFDRLLELTGNGNKARLLDKFLFWWQGSTYTLDNDDSTIWFTRSLDSIAEGSKIAKRSVQRYMAEFVEAGFIEKRCKLLRKKNLYIRVTDKLLALIKTIDRTTDSKQDSSFNNQIGHIEKAKEATTYNKNIEPIVNGNSTISDTCIVNNADASLEKQEEKPPAVEKLLGETITDRLKSYILGVVKNLQEQHNVKISKPDKLFAEVVFSATNKESHFPKIKDMQHRINVIAKMIREGQWRTPKGFYNHSEAGQQYREREEVQRRKYQADKEAEGVDVTKAKQAAHNFAPAQTKTQEYKQRQEAKRHQQRVRELERQIVSEERNLHKMQSWVTKGIAGASQALVDSLAITVAKLYEKLEIERAV